MTALFYRAHGGLRLQSTQALLMIKGPTATRSLVCSSAFRSYGSSDHDHDQTRYPRRYLICLLLLQRLFIYKHVIADSK